MRIFDIFTGQAAQDAANAAGIAGLPQAYGLLSPVQPNTDIAKFSLFHASFLNVWQHETRPLWSHLWPSHQSNGEFRLCRWPLAPLDMRHCSALPPANRKPPSGVCREKSAGKHSEVCRDQYDAGVGCPSA